MRIKQWHKAGRSIIYDSALVGEIDEHIFDPAYHQKIKSLQGQALGRGTTYFVEVGGVDCVLRHYRRGGMMAKVFHDRYVWLGIKNTRAWREWNLLQHLQEINLPVPRPVAARVLQKGLYYRGDLITQRIENAETLTTILQKNPITEALWKRLGGTIKRFHSAGIYHADLNAQNILINAESSVFLIDFDKGSERVPQWSWQLQNLNRLQRSLNKSRNVFANFQFSQQDWQALLDGYQAG